MKIKTLGAAIQQVGVWTVLGAIALMFMGRAELLDPHSILSWTLGGGLLLVATGYIVLSVARDETQNDEQRMADVAADVADLLARVERLEKATNQSPDKP